MKSLLIYPTVIFMVFYFSGFNKEMKYYNKHLITLYGTTVYSHSLPLSKDFYSQLLELPLLEESSDKLAFMLPDNRKLSVTLKEDLNIPAEPKEVITIRVRNGVKGLQEEFKKNINKKLSSQEKGLDSHIQISSLEKTDRGKEFYLSDPSNNRITFFQKSIFSRSK